MPLKAQNDYVLNILGWAFAPPGYAYGRER